MVQKTGVKLWFQQINALIFKRFFIFTRRYILALISLFMPLVLEAIICLIIPSGSSIQSALTRTVSSSGSVNLQVSNYAPYTFPYALTGNSANFQNLLSTYYTTSNRPGITLQNCSYDNVSSVVLQLRKDDVRNLASNYYTGMSFNIVNSTNLYATAYYSTFVYHSPGVVLNEISNLILAYYSSNSLTNTISTTNTPIASSSTLTGNNFVDYLACLDTLPLSILNFINAIVIGFVISFIVVHVGRERINGSKSLQLLSGTHFVTYWTANHIFDFIICFFNIGTMIAMLKLVNSIKNDSTIEIYSIGIDPQINYYLLLMFLSIFSWVDIFR
jgi:hypothetical protein